MRSGNTRFPRRLRIITDSAAQIAEPWARDHQVLVMAQRIRFGDKVEGWMLLQKIRDEAHRFAITAHRRQRSKQGIASILDKVPGIGPGRRKLLLERFGTLDAIRQASIEQLTEVKGITEEIALNLKAQLE